MVHRDVVLTGHNQRMGIERCEPDQPKTAPRRAREALWALAPAVIFGYTAWQLAWGVADFAEMPIVGRIVMCVFLAMLVCGLVAQALGRTPSHTPRRGPVRKECSVCGRTAIEAFVPDGASGGGAACALKPAQQEH
ncbi:hypothetical protein MGALJ_61020 (plasmid) [Mycobacterium gallinarum]|uniref:Uncharacterized protein n=2 Tax=Mycobacterium gallinarum TaxID=39689 RepID=A0A9W4B9B9_9MYCO|nr:hypothetical protein MGALJ_61020 [Mycobacterium gallinarum]